MKTIGFFLPPLTFLMNKHWNEKHVWNISLPPIS